MALLLQDDEVEKVEVKNDQDNFEAIVVAMCCALAPVAEAGAMTTKTITLLVAW